MESNYAKQIDDLREISMEGKERVKIMGQKGCSHSFAIGHIGWAVESRERNGIKELKIFTGVRIWWVPEQDCQIIASKNK